MAHTNLTIEQQYHLRPRNDFVVFQIHDIGATPAGVHIPEISAEGKERVVLAIGPEVEGLEVGDSVMVIGTVGQDVVRIPRSREVYLTKQANVVLVLEEKGE